MAAQIPGVNAKIAEYYEFIASLGEDVDPLQAAMFVELEFNVVIPDAEITPENLGDAVAATALVLRSVGASEARE